MRRRQKVAATLGLCLVTAFGSPASAAFADGRSTADAEDPLSRVMAVEDPIHNDIAEATLEVERLAGISDPSAGSN
jgi:hypothetical protein